MPIKILDTQKRIGVDIDDDTYLRTITLIEQGYRAKVVRVMYDDLLDLLERSKDRRMMIAAIISGYIRLSLAGKKDDMMEVVREVASASEEACRVSRFTVTRAKDIMRRMEGIKEIASDETR